MKRIDAARTKASEDYKVEILDHYFEKNEDGTFKRPEDDPQGYVPLEAKKEELKKVDEDFHNREVVIDWTPMPLSVLSDIKLSGNDLIALDLLVNDAQEGPGLPEEAGFQMPPNMRKLGKR